jgi:hypothetical protein
LAMTQIISNALIAPQSLGSNIMRALSKNIVKLAEFKATTNAYQNRRKFIQLMVYPTRTPQRDFLQQDHETPLKGKPH